MHEKDHGHQSRRRGAWLHIMWYSRTWRYPRMRNWYRLHLRYGYVCQSL